MMVSRMKLYKLKKLLKRTYKQFSVLNKLKKNTVTDINSKPKVLNLNIIDSCNSKCTMCNIWKRDEALEISPSQLQKVLQDPLFSELEHVGVTGGEPTLREDLPDVYKAIIKARPNITGLSIITNAINSEDVLNRIKHIKSICDENQIHFSAMVSIDGVGKVHDQVRGVKGNFDTAIKVFKFLQDELKIKTDFGCTISKINVWDVDDLLFYAKKNNLNGRFRVAETINRLYNNDRGKVIRNFDDDETYHSLLFFEKLKRTFEKNVTYVRTYSSIQNMLMGGDRQIGCPYHKNGVVLGSKGQLSYCAPKSKEIGNALNTSSLKLYKDNFNEKKRILNENCKSCIHDYHAPITYAEHKSEIKKYWNNQVLRSDKTLTALIISKFLKAVAINKNKYRVFVFGWYGTETVGDKAILGGIVNYYKEAFGKNLEIVIGSLYPFVTKRTCKELNLDAKVVSTQNIDLFRYAKSSDEVVMGGGPLMDLDELYVPHLGFKVAKKYNKKTTVFGCGIGPLKTKENSEIVKKIFSLTDNVKLRDQSSINAYNKFGFNNPAEFYGDPAKNYVLSVNKNIEIVKEKESVLCCYLRAWTFEYFDGTLEDFEILKSKFEKGIVNLIKQEADKLDVDRIEFHHMHNFVIGNDDRDFSRYFVDKYFFNDERVWINKKLSTVESTIVSMQKSKLNICMRFHSVLFAHTLDTNFIALDYTMGGKIEAYLKDNNAIKNRLTINNIISIN